MVQVVDLKELADTLKISYRTLLKVWRDLPHFYVGVGRNLKSARFDPVDVLDHLKARDYERMEGQAAGHVDRQVRASGAPVPEKGLRHTVGGPKVGSRRKGKAQPAADPNDPYGLLTGIKRLS